MSIIENSIVINRPVDVVFAYLGAYENDYRWRGGIRVMTTSTPMTQVGMDTREVVRFLGRDYLTLARITEIVPNSKVAFKSMQGTFPTLGWRAVKAVEGGTRATIHTEINLSGAVALAAPLLVPLFSRQMRADLRRLKQRLES